MKKSKTVSNRVFAITVFIFFSLMIGVSLYMWQRQAHNWEDQVMSEHINKLHAIFMRIDADCQIIGFEHQKNHIDFLNVVKFVGSEVGSMNLAHPENWQGPYVQDNPTMHEKQYQIVATHKGYFIVPGDGITLSNGKVIGTDIIFDENADIQAMLTDAQGLTHKDYVFAAHLPIQAKHPNQAEQVIVGQDLE